MYLATGDLADVNAELEQLDAFEFLVAITPRTLTALVLEDVLRPTKRWAEAQVEVVARAIRRSLTFSAR
jgi:hypothetical protein